jgi:hypothetical protein
MAPITFSAFILPSRVGAVLAAEQATCPHVGNQCGKSQQGESDIQQVYHVFLGVEPAMLRARHAGSHDMSLAVKAAQRSHTFVLRFHKEAGSLSSNTAPPPWRSEYESVPF